MPASFIDRIEAVDPSENVTTNISQDVPARENVQHNDESHPAAPLPSSSVQTNKQTNNICCCHNTHYPFFYGLSTNILFYNFLVVTSKILATPIEAANVVQLKETLPSQKG